MQDTAQVREILPPPKGWGLAKDRISVDLDFSIISQKSGILGGFDNKKG